MTKGKNYCIFTFHTCKNTQTTNKQAPRGKKPSVFAFKINACSNLRPRASACFVQGTADSHKQSRLLQEKKMNSSKKKTVHFLLVAANCFYAGLPTIFCTLPGRAARRRSCTSCLRLSPHGLSDGSHMSEAPSSGWRSALYPPAPAWHCLTDGYGRV